ncbi:MAG: Fur family transcriptional regulator [Nocardioides sp.]|nr:Fur family transcriptional regulator [Nocardioides sp.]
MGAAGAGSTDWQERLRARGYRATPQRELVLAAVQRLRHATPDDVLSEVRRTSASLNLSTVYRTLEVLEEVGLIRHAHLSDRAPTYHAMGEDEHFHLVCRSCGAVLSVGSAEGSAFVDALRAKHGFAADLGHLTVFGTCADC